jgi:hypothetical protein
MPEVLEEEEEEEEEGHIFSYGSKLNYIYACTVIPYGIEKVKNALIRSVYYVTAYVICSLDNFSNSVTELQNDIEVVK